MESSEDQPLTCLFRTQLQQKEENQAQHWGQKAGSWQRQDWPGNTSPQQGTHSHACSCSRMGKENELATPFVTGATYYWRVTHVMGFCSFHPKILSSPAGTPGGSP